MDDFKSMASDEKKGMISDIRDKATQKVEEIRTQASTALKDAAQNASTRIEQNLDGAVQGAGEKLSQAGAKMWEKIPSEGVVGDMVGGIAAKVEEGGEYLAGAKARDIVADMADMARSHPLGTMTLVFSMGFLMGSILKRK